MRASYIQTEGDRRTKCISCECLRPVSSIEDEVCGTCRKEGITGAEVRAWKARGSK